eukprot:CAMPEP_0114431854 /NCGR_PEP_ID=MMETSP0103-20121206/10834_1 /TAXON_ID=37642 ORGANISM="Paraphysomonas imperforata, Strain PA2" /NCGR_SAMPLE_ID=MMETSP0103 /ASSEMBLY_ACC=CAM_ASM_000201 /LENGTH=1306 /DNA_ID=CAMNT_0001601471 /DNA_START=25 /DNA_END=3945 /DNA_ORIENTATION=-
MEDDWEDFLGLDDKPLNDTSGTANDRDNDDEAFQLPEKVEITPLKNVTYGEEDILATDDHLGDDNAFDMDFLSSVDSPPPPVSLSTDVLTDDDTQGTAIVEKDETDDVRLSSKSKSDPTSTAMTEIVNDQTTALDTPEPSADDFMSWLDDKKTVEEVKSSTQDTSTPNTKLVMDSFFDEVFGDDENNPLIPSRETGATVKNFESQLRKEVSTGFCDANKIRNLILGAGFLPRAFRGQVWSILTGGSCNEDQEAEFWRPSGNEQVENKDNLMRDCATAIAVRKGTAFCPADLEQTEIDLTDILLLYCMRRKRAYHLHYTSLLTPLLVTPLPATRALASSCFYSLCSEFIPLINLTPVKYERAVQKVNEWIRLLLSYHFPLLVLHLDRVFPGWEQAVQLSSSSDMFLNTTESLKSASLDEMERELGFTDELDVDSTSGSGPSSDASRVSSQSHKENRDRHDANDGCIPSPWISGIFGDAMPPEQACAILDWAILNEEKFFGVYFIVSLFGLYSTTLLTMNRPQIKAWITKIAFGVSGNGAEWFKHLALITTPELNSDNLLEINDGVAPVEMDWKIFMRGWLHATTSLWKATPRAFKEALANTELWANNVLDEDGLDGATPTLEKRQDLDDSGTDSKKAKMLKMKSAMEAKSRNVLKRFSKKVDLVRKSSPASFEVDNLNKWEDDEDDSRDWLQQWAHVSKKNFRCLWASAEEVIPSICSTQRKPTVTEGRCSGESKDFAAHFCHGCEWTEGCSEFGIERKGGEGMSFPQLKDEQHNMMATPMYFAVDIRSEAEMKLGKFPKAFTLDPQFLSDPDMISNYLSTLEPVSEIAHLCIMGVGEEYIQAKVSSNGSNHSKSSLDTPSTSFALLDEALAEYHATLMNVVVFFMKKGFRHVSILDGGFVAAARHLLRDDCSSTLGSALVDVSPLALDRILGEGVCAKHLGIKKASSPSSLFSEQDGKPPTGTNALGTTVNSAIANFSASAVGTNLGSFVNNLATQVSAAGGPSEDSRPQSEGQDSTGAGGGYGASSTAEVGRRLSVLGSSALTSLRKGVSVVSGVPPPPPQTSTTPSPATGSDLNRGEVKSRISSTKSTSGGGMQFVIDEDEDDDEEEDNEAGHGKDDAVGDSRPTGGEDNATVEQKQASRLADSIPDTDTVNVVRSEAEKSQALAMHILAGVQKGDEVKIAKDSLPGAVLFPALKDKLDKDEDGMVLLDTKGEPKTKPVHRFLVVTKERFIVLDSGGKGVGSVGLVKSNHHLTELIKITFKKKDPDGVILFISSPGKEPKPHSYKVAKRNDFIKTLQEKMKRFK